MMLREGHPSKATIERLRALAKERLAAKQQNLPGSALPAPRYDEVFAKGQAWLEDLAGDPVEAFRGTLAIDDAVGVFPTGTDETD